MNLKQNSNDSSEELKKNSQCSFCGQKCDQSLRFFGKNQDSDIFICEKCIFLGFKVLMAEKFIEPNLDGSDFKEKDSAFNDFKSKTFSSNENNSDNKNQNFAEKNLSDFIPIKIKGELDQYVIGQDNAKKMLSVAVYNHLKRIKDNSQKNQDCKISKSNILIIGPTGCGKTLMANTIAKILNVPYASCDATALTETGYVGEDASVIIERLLQSAGGSVLKAQQGIGCIDEIDKIAKKSESISGVRDVSGEGVQQALLKILEGTTAYVSPSGNKRGLNAEMIPVDTENILFVCCGAFSGIEKIISKRLISNSIGFDAKIKNTKENMSNILKNIEAEDLIEYGLIPEFVSRLHTICVLSDLDEKLLVKILVEPKNSIIKQYQKLFHIDNVKLEFTESALFAIASEARKRKSGARALRSILESLLYELMFDIPSNFNENSSDECLLNEKTSCTINKDDQKNLISSCELNIGEKSNLEISSEVLEKVDSCSSEKVIVIDEKFVKNRFTNNKNIISE